MVTVVITTCKREPEIVKRAVMSVIRQTYTEWEIFVIDDSPKDWPLRKDIEREMVSLAETNRIIYIQNESNKGACFSRNVGLHKANGEYVAFLDDDDEWLSDKLKKQVNALENASADVALVYGPFYIEYDETEIKVSYECPFLSGELYEEIMKRGNLLGGMSIPLMRTQCVIDVGGFDELMQSSQDVDLWLRMTKKYKAIGLPDYLAIYHIHDGEQITKNPQKKIEGLKRINEKNADFLQKNKAARWYREKIIIPYLLLLGKRQEAMKSWMTAVSACPFKLKENFRELARIIVSPHK